MSVHQNYSSVFRAIAPQLVDLEHNPIEGLNSFYHTDAVDNIHFIYSGLEGSVFSGRQFVFLVVLPVSYPRSEPIFHLVCRRVLAIDLLFDIVDSDGVVHLDTLANRKPRQIYQVTPIRVQLLELKQRVDNVLMVESNRLSENYPSYHNDEAFRRYYQFFGMIAFVLDSGLMATEHAPTRNLPGSVRLLLGRNFVRNNDAFRLEVEVARLECEAAGIDLLPFQHLHRLFVLWWTAGSERYSI